MNEPKAPRTRSSLEELVKSGVGEIRDVMNRVKHPSLVIMARVFSGDGGEPRLILRIANSSDVMARHFAVNVRFPIRIGHGFVRCEGAFLEKKNEESYWEFTEIGGLQPLFPHSMRVLKRDFQWVNAFNPPLGKTIDHIRLRAFADNMTPIELDKNLHAAETDWT